MSETLKNVLNAESSSETLDVELMQADEENIVEASSKKTILQYIKIVLKWVFLFIVIFLFGGSIFLKICHCIADIFDTDYSVVWKNVLLFLLCGISFNLYRVRTDISTRTGYKKNFTPSNAIFLFIKLFLLYAILFLSTLVFDKNGILIDKLVGKKSTVNVVQNFKEETTNENQNVLDSSNMDNTSRMYFRD